MVHPADDAMAEALKAIPITQRRLANPRHVYGGMYALVDLKYSDVVEIAAKSMRSGIDRATAVEMAYDHCLGKASVKAWRRTGEVILQRRQGTVRALCQMREGG
jgi:nucleoside 2-deoxyribosyltransferase